MSKSTTPTSKPVGTTDAHPQERTARELLTQDSLFLGVDGEGAAHYWDSYEFAVAVVAADALAGRASTHRGDCVGRPACVPQLTFLLTSHSRSPSRRR